MKKSGITIFCALCLILVSTLINANEIFVSPGSLSVNQGENFNLEIKGNTFTSISDIYGIEFNINYNPSLISPNSITEGNLLNNNGQVVTIFRYETTLGNVRVYNIRNSSSGTYNNGSFAVLNFHSIASGTVNINLDEVLWINSTITNMSAGIPNVIVTNGIVSINSVSPPGGFGGGGGGGGGGSSSNNAQTTPENNPSNPPSGTSENNQIPEFSEPQENYNQETPDDSEKQTGFLAFTGGIIEGITKGEILRSWVFYLVILSAIFVGAVYLRKRYHERFEFIHLFKKRRR